MRKDGEKWRRRRDETDKSGRRHEMLQTEKEKKGGVNSNELYWTMQLFAQTTTLSFALTTHSNICGAYPGSRLASPWKRLFHTYHTTATPVRDEWRTWSSFPPAIKSQEKRHTRRSVTKLLAELMPVYLSFGQSLTAPKESDSHHNTSPHGHRVDHCSEHHSPEHV